MVVSMPDQTADPGSATPIHRRVLPCTGIEPLKQDRYSRSSSEEGLLYKKQNIYAISPETFRGMRRAILILCAILLLGLPAGALTPHWRSTAPSDVTTLSISADGSYILTGGERVCLFAGDGTPLWREWSADLVACSADGSRIACADGQFLFLLDREGTMVWRQEMPSTSALLALSADGKRIVVADRFGKVYFYDAEGKLQATVDTSSGDERSEIHAIAISDRGENTAVISTRGLFYYRDAGRKVWAHDEITDRGTAIAVSGSGKDIAAGSDAGVRFLDSKGNLIWSQKFHRPVTALAISEDGSCVIVGSQDNMVRCFDREGEEIWAHEAGGWIRDIAVSKDGKRVLVGSMDKRVYLLDGAGELLGTCALEGWVNRVALSADGATGVAASTREVIGIRTAGTPTETPTGTPTETVEPVETLTETPAETVEPTEIPTEPTGTQEPAGAPGEGAGPYLLILALLACGAVLGAGYLYRKRPGPLSRAAREARESISPAATKEEVVEAPPPEVTVPAPWKAPLEEGDLRGAARILLGQMTTLVRERTGKRIITTADALEACPDHEREEFRRFFDEGNRLAYAAAEPTREEILALEAAYLRLAGEDGW